MDRELCGAVVAVLVVLLAMAAIPGCVSPESMLPAPGEGDHATATPTPAGTHGAGGVEGAGGVASDISQRQGTPQYYVRTPYGYVLATPRTGSKLAIIEIKEVADASGQEYLTGRIKNDENYRIDHITLNFNLYNSKGNLIGNAYASVNFLDPGKVWMFATNSFPSKDYHYYELKEAFVV